ncbi:MAG TPA: hypothetical protein VFT50_01400 [Baekduia sp.]|nr:hypothetical protein [Baekduia sp.]
MIVVAGAVVLLALTLSASMRGRRKRGDATHRELREAQESAERAERARDVAEEQSERRADPNR